MNNNRVEWVDIAKGFAIIAVVLGHINYQYPRLLLLPISTIIAWLWHVPVFFMIGGFFLKDEKIVKPLCFIKGKIMSLYLLIMYMYIPFTLLHNWFFDIGFYENNIDYGGKYVDSWSTGQFVKGILGVIFLAGREPIMGAMWFAYVLFMSLCYLSVISYFIKKITSSLHPDLFEKVRCCVLLGGAVAASFLTNVFDFNIPRFNNVFTASWLIYIGMQAVQRYKVSFNSSFLLCISIIVFYSFAVLRGGVSLNRNNFDDIVSLTCSSLSALYIVCYLSKKCCGWMAMLMSMIGRDSFYIMGLHFLSFKLCSCLIILCGSHAIIAELNAPADNIFLYLYYALGGIFLPLLFLFIWRKIILLFKKTT